MDDRRAASLPVYTGDDLGAAYTKQKTVFKLWAPTAASVALHLYTTGTDSEPGARELGFYPMTRQGEGVWSAVVQGDANGIYYTYALTFDSPPLYRTTIVDPYARACGANGRRGMVIDLDAAAPDGWDKDAHPRLDRHANAVWECHVADFSGDEHSGVPKPWRGKYMAFTVTDSTLDDDKTHPTCLNYIKGLGVSHVQLQPIFDFATVDEVRGGYNWGYDPLNFNIPEGSYATDSYHGEVRVRECRAMVAALHSAGLGVVMDVVYNHTFNKYSWLERSVPGYWNRCTPQGEMTNGSGCGCDLASERPMVRKYIVDSVCYWAKEYHIDGFRFDLMALLDVDTMNAVRAALDALPGGRDILLYGEPWAGGATNMDPGAVPADKAALDKLDSRIGFFCDDTRDAIKGDVFLPAQGGYINGDPRRALRLLHAPGAWRSGAGGFTPRAASQVVQYVSAHDNATLWDKLCAVGGVQDFDVPNADLLAQNRMAAGILCTCQGLPLFYAGEEFGRTKHGNENSYRGPLVVNALAWRRAYQSGFVSLVRYYRGLLAIRRAYPALAGAAGEPAPFLLALPGWLIGFVVESQQGGGDLAVFYNAETSPQQVDLPTGFWQTLCDGTHAQPQPFGKTRSGTVNLPAKSVVILLRVGP